MKQKPSVRLIYFAQKQLIPDEIYQYLSFRKMYKPFTNLNATLSLSLFELKTFIDYDLKIDKHESNTAFWNFVGNPLYRIHERCMVEKCRDSDEYRKRLFEKMESLIKELRSREGIISKT